MSEFKFACPICGQHITADSSAAGSQLDCPTCFRSIVVPQAPASRESKLVLTATEAGRSRSAAERVAAAPSSPAQSAPARLRRWAFAGAVIVVIAIAIAAVALFTRTAFREGDDGKPLAREPSEPRGPWKLDLSSAEFPETTASGFIKGQKFTCERAVLQGGILSLRMGDGWPPDLGVSVQLFARRPEQLAGKSAIINSNNIRFPRVVLRWKSDGANRVEAHTNGFAMRLEFGQRTNNHLPGKIYVCTPDNERSWIGGAFEAEIRGPSPRPDSQ